MSTSYRTYAYEFQDDSKELKDSGPWKCGIKKTHVDVAVFACVQYTSSMGFQKNITSMPGHLRSWPSTTKALTGNGTLSVVVLSSTASRIELTGENSLSHHRAHCSPDLRSAGPFVVSCNRILPNWNHSENRGLETKPGARVFERFVRCSQQRQKHAHAANSSMERSCGSRLPFSRRTRGY